MPGMGPTGVDTIGSSPSAVDSTVGAVTAEAEAVVELLLLLLLSLEACVSLLGVKSMASSSSKRAKK